MPWAAGKKRLTKAFAVAIATWARLLPWLQVARQFQCSWGTVAAAVAYVVAFGLARRDLSDVTHIGIDEISRQKGHVYLTNVYDLRTGALIWSGEGRTKDTLAAFFDFFGSERTAKLVGICCDMWPSYIETVKARAPHATLVFDKFHIVRQLTEAVDKVRRQEVAEKGAEHKGVLAGTRYIWLKNPWNLTDRQKASLAFLETLNLKIHRAYLLKESFRDFWQSATKEIARKFMEQWFAWAMESKIKPMQDFALLLKRHEENILTYFNMPISNGAVEGLNNKAKVISHLAYGFRSAKNYILNLYHCMGDLPMPTSMHRFV
jgi:transposase